MKRFCEMSLDELLNYDGPVYVARCEILHRHTGHIAPHDFEEPTRELRDQAVKDAVKNLGMLISLTNHTLRHKPRR